MIGKVSKEVQTMSKDIIYREDAIKAINLRARIPHDVASAHYASMAINAIRSVPSADRPQGGWKHLKGDEWLCPECGHVIWTEGSWEHPLERGKFYCENCGARMKGADDE